MPTKYIQRIEAGLCGQCGERPRDGDRTTCTPCRERAREGQALRQRRRVVEGRCRTCGLRSPIEGSRECRPCLDRYARYARAHEREWRAAGLCPHCGRERDGDEEQCAVCRGVSRGVNARRPLRVVVGEHTGPPSVGVVVTLICGHTVGRRRGLATPPRVRCPDCATVSGT